MIRIPFFSKKPPPIAPSDDLELEEDPVDIEEDQGGFKYKLYPRSPLSVPPGEILKLVYAGSGEKTVLVTATERGPRGNFLSTRDNNLLCCFELNENSITFKIVLKLFHKKENRCHYKLVPNFLKFVFGLSAFKTLDIMKISSMEILLKDSKVK
jgi:hypothetical protein